MLVALRTLGLALVTVVYYVAMELARLAAPRAGRDAVTRAWMRRYGRTALRLLGVELLSPLPSGEFLPGRGAGGRGRVFVVNHRSVLDVYVYLALLEANALSRADLARWPIIGRPARRVGTVFVDRADRSSGSGAVAAMAGALLTGRGILVFPEGTTFAGDEVRPFRAGAFVAAARAGAEVIPLGFAYETDEACFVDESFGRHWLRVAGRRSMRVAAEIGEPRGPGGDAEALRAGAQQDVQELVHRARARLGGGLPAGGA